MFDQEKTIQSARSTILAVVIFTLINIFAIAFAEYYFLYSAYVPQVLIAFALYESPGLLMPMVIASLVYMLPYLLCYIFSKKRKGWMKFALILFLIDTILFGLDFVAMLAAGEFGFIIDLVIHVIVLISLFSGLKAYPKKER